MKVTGLTFNKIEVNFRALGMNLCIRGCFSKLFGCFCVEFTHVNHLMLDVADSRWRVGYHVLERLFQWFFRVETHLIYLNLGYRFVHDHHHLSIIIYPSSIIHHPSSSVADMSAVNEALVPRNIAGWVGSIGRSSVEAEQVRWETSPP